MLKFKEIIILSIICLNHFRVLAFRTDYKASTLPNLSENKMNERILQIEEFQSEDGSFKLPLSYNGDNTWSAKIPIPDLNSVKTAMVSLYLDQSWFYGNEEVATKASCINDRSEQSLIFSRVEGVRCSLLAKLSKNNQITYKFIYSNQSDFPLPSGTLGIVGLGISKNTLPANLKPESQMFSLYLNKNYGVPSYILFGKVDKRFIEDKPPQTVQPLSANNWTFALSNFKIIQKPSPLSLKVQSQAILDLNHDFIGVPHKYFEEIFSPNQKEGLKTCTVEPSKTSLLCSCRELNLTRGFEFILGNQNLIVSNSSIIEYFDEKCRLKLACVTSSPLHPDCLLVNQDFENVWILGSPFLSYFRTLFSYDTHLKHAEASFYIAKTQVDMRQMFKDKLAKEQPNALVNTLKDLIAVLGAFAVLFALYVVIRKFFAFIIEKKKKYYQNYQAQELDEDDHSATHIEDGDL